MTSEEILTQYGPREAMEYDVVVVGAGPAGLATAIRLKQLAAADGKEVSVVVLEKGSEPGAHILSRRDHGPARADRAAARLEGARRAAEPAGDADRFLFLTETGAKATPDFLLPDCFNNHGNYIISLGNVVRWLAQQAEALGVEIFPGFPAAEVLYNDDGAVKGVATGNLGIGKDGEPTDGLPARHGAARQVHRVRRRLARPPRQAADRPLQARRRQGPAELRHRPQGAVGDRPGEARARPRRPHRRLAARSGDLRRLLPLPPRETTRSTLGFVVGLDYANPWLNPFEELQRWKTHPAIRTFLEGGKRLGYGARAITAGGILSLPKTVFPGGALVGCEAGYLNASRIKGSHAAIKTGMLAAEAAYAALAAGRQHDELTAYPAGVRVELAARRARPRRATSSSGSRRAARPRR